MMLPKYYEYFKEFRQLLEEHYKDIRTVEVYAKMMNISKKTVNLATRNTVGLSAKSYIVNRIILEIKRYLSQGNLMNYEIAELLGFEEAGNMSRFFKHYEGISPKKFREKLIEDNK
jgi:AraC-like DNA-binding protein